MHWAMPNYADDVTNKRCSFRSTQFRRFAPFLFMKAPPNIACRLTHKFGFFRIGTWKSQAILRTITSPYHHRGGGGSLEFSSLSWPQMTRGPYYNGLKLLLHCGFHCSLNQSKLSLFIGTNRLSFSVYMFDQKPLLYKGRTQIGSSLASKMKHLVAGRSQIVASVNFGTSISARGSQNIINTSS